MTRQSCIFNVLCDSRMARHDKESTHRPEVVEAAWWQNGISCEFNRYVVRSLFYTQMYVYIHFNQHSSWMAGESVCCQRLRPRGRWKCNIVEPQRIPAEYRNRAFRWQNKMVPSEVLVSYLFFSPSFFYYCYYYRVWA